MLRCEEDVDLCSSSTLGGDTQVNTASGEDHLESGGRRRLHLSYGRDDAITDAMQHLDAAQKHLAQQETRRTRTSEEYCGGRDEEETRGSSTRARARTHARPQTTCGGVRRHEHSSGTAEGSEETGRAEPFLLTHPRSSPASSLSHPSILSLFPCLNRSPTWINKVASQLIKYAFRLGTKEGGELLDLQQEGGGEEKEAGDTEGNWRRRSDLIQRACLLSWKGNPIIWHFHWPDGVLGVCSQNGRRAA